MNQGEKETEIQTRWAEIDREGVEPLLGLWVALVNQVYLLAEKGLWKPGYERVQPNDIASLIGEGQLLVAYEGETPVGCVMVKKLSDKVGEWGLLVAHPEKRGRGIGRTLVERAEHHLTRLGCSTIQIEVLHPKGWNHPMKDRLHQWYTRIGYREVRDDPLEDYYPQLVEWLAGECRYVVYEKEMELR